MQYGCIMKSAGIKTGRTVLLPVRIAVVFCLCAAVSAQTISISDIPSGFAGYNAPSPFGGTPEKTYTVSTKTDLVKYAQKGGCVIYIDGMIDMTEGMLPASYDGSSPALDAFISKKTNGKYSTYASLRNAYAAACTVTTDDGSSSSPQSAAGNTLWTLNKAYGNMIEIHVASNTSIIGSSAACGIKGGSFIISGVSNIALRNLTICDAYDPFPHHEKNDGYNAQHDCITVQGTTSNIWIDHCTLEDTFSSFVHVQTGGTADEKWQTYDGLCDIKGSAKSVTVSYCRFMNHDKTMLIGSSDSESFSGTRSITLHHNYYYNCIQRLPMVRLSTIHIYNNYYDADSSSYQNAYAVGVRYNSRIVSENNYFGKGIRYSYRGTTSKQGTVYYTGDTDNSSAGKKTDEFKKVSSGPFNPADFYAYTAEDASSVKDTVTANAGAGVWTVQK